MRFNFLDVPAERVNRYYEQLTPARQAFFDAFATRLQTGEVFFNRDVADLMSDLNPERTYPDSAASNLLLPNKSACILRRYGVILMRGYFGGSDYVRKRATYHDAQLDPHTLQLGQSLQRQNYGIDEDGTFLERGVPEAIASWQTNAVDVHSEVLAYTRRRKQPLLHRSPVRLSAETAQLQSRSLEPQNAPYIPIRQMRMLPANAERGKSFFDTLTPERQEFYRHVTAALKQGRVLVHADLVDMFEETDTKGSKTTFYGGANIGQVLQTPKSSDIALHLQVTLAMGRLRYQGKREALTYHDAQLPPDRTDIEQTARRLAGLSSEVSVDRNLSIAINEWRLAALYSHLVCKDQLELPASAN